MALRAPGAAAHEFQASSLRTLFRAQDVKVVPSLRIDGRAKIDPVAASAFPRNVSVRS